MPQTPRPPGSIVPPETPDPGTPGAEPAGDPLAEPLVADPLVDDPLADPDATLPSRLAAHAIVEAAEVIAEAKVATDIELRARRLRLFAFDVDGTLTDGTIYIGNQGEVMKAFSVHDGFALVAMRRAGWKIALITGRSSQIVQRRAEELGIEIVMQGVDDKAQALREACARAGVGLEDAGFMGDDWPDLPALRAATFAATLQDAPDEIRDAAHWVATRPAGRGAVRELAEWLMRLRGEWRMP